MARRGITHLAVIAVCAAAAVAVRLEGQQPPPRDEKAENFSPLGFEDLRAYEQAFPGTPGSLDVVRASTAKYWIFRGVAYRGSQAHGAAWASLGPISTTAGGASGSGSFSGRVAALAISPACAVNGPCRLWVGTAGGGVWRTDDAMTADDAGWRWIGQGLGTNSIGSLAVDPTDASGDTIYVGTGETNSPQNSGAGTGLYRSTDGGDHWSRISTNIVDTAVSPSAIDFTATRGIGSIAIDPGNARVLYVGTTTAMLGMTAVRGGQSQTTGYPQPRVGLYKTTDGGATWTLAWVPPLDPVVPDNPDRTPGQGDTMIGVRKVMLDPKDPRIVYATAWNNAIHRSAAPLEGGDASFKPVFAIEGFGRFQDLAMFDLTRTGGHTRIYAYNGTLATASQGLYRLDNADVAASSLVTGSGASLSNTDKWQRLSSNDASQPGSTSRALCSTQCFYDLVVATPPGRPDTVLIGGVATPTFGESTLRSTNAGASFTAFSSDAQDPRNSSHVDVRTIAFHPRSPQIAFVGSDGGVVRNDGSFTSIANRCQALFDNAPQCSALLASVPTRLYFLNRGLQTLQFYNVSVDPRAPLQRLIGGLQDNGTVWTDGTLGAGVWKSLFPFGDGTSASGFHPSRPGVMFASFQSNRFFVNFANGDLARWVRIDDPIPRRGRTRDDHGVDGAPVHLLRRGPSRHRVHRIPARVADEGQRRQPGVPGRELPLHRRIGRGVVRRLDAAWRGVPVSVGLDARIGQPPAGRPHRRRLWKRPGGRHRRRGRALSCRRRHALGGDERRPAVRLDQRGRARSGCGVHADRHRRDAEPLRHAHRPRPRESQRRLCFLQRLQRAHAVVAGSRVSRGVQPVDEDGLVQRPRPRPGRPADQHAGR